MSIRFTSLLVAGLLVSQYAAAAEQCTRPADRAAFDMEGLKSELMVTALSCNAQERYNTFISRYRSDLGTQEKALTAYFTRSYGRAGQKAHDDYVTQLANVQSGDGLKAGTLFCARNVAMFDEVAALKSGSEIPDYVAGKDITQPVAFSNCTAAEPATRHGAAHEAREVHGTTHTTTHHATATKKS
ncbi:MAG: hypothetical protein ACRYHQ_04180 [Janthinobacterium lividum]